MRAGSLRAAALYAALTVVLTYPAGLPPAPDGRRRLRVLRLGDRLGAARAAHRPSRLPHGNMFFPLRYTLGMDEPVLGTSVARAAARARDRRRRPAYNVARLLTFVLSALSAYLLARELGASEGPSLLAGAAFAFSPIRVDQIAHLSTLGTQWLPLVVLFAFRFFRAGPRPRRALAAGSLFALEAYACGYHGVIGLLVLPLGFLPLLWGRWCRLPLAVADAALAAAALLPLYLLHRAALEPAGLRARAGGDGDVLGRPRVLPGHQLLEPRLGRADRALPRPRTPTTCSPASPCPFSRWRGRLTLARAGRRPSREAWALVVMALADGRRRPRARGPLAGARPVPGTVRARARAAALPHDPRAQPRRHLPRPAPGAAGREGAHDVAAAPGS